MSVLARSPAPRHLTTWLLLGLLTACTRSPQPAPHEVAPPAPAPIEQAILEPPSAPPAVPAPADLPTTTPRATVPLDLSYRSVDGDTDPNPQAPDARAYEQTRLPPLLNQGKDSGPISVRGKLLTDPERGDLIQAVEGAQLSLEMKTR